MKTKTPVSIKKQPVTVKDLTTKKNPKGGVITKDSWSTKGANKFSESWTEGR